MIPLAAWAAPRLEPLPLPRALQVGLAVLAPLAFTATSQPRSVVRSTLDVSSEAVVDAAALQAFFDDVAKDHGLRCTICDSLDEGRVYSRQDADKNALDSFTVNFDSERGRLFYTADASGSPAREGVLAMSAAIRAGMQQRFPSVATIEFADGLSAQPENSTLFTITLPPGPGPRGEAPAEASRTMEAIAAEVARAHGLRQDETTSIYYLGRRFGSAAHDRELVLIPVVTGTNVLRIRVAIQTANYASLQQSIIDEVASRLDAAFGSGAVTRETTLVY